VEPEISKSSSEEKISNKGIKSFDKYGNIRPLKLSLRLESLKEVFAYFHISSGLEELLLAFGGLDDAIKRPFFQGSKSNNYVMKVKRNYMPSTLDLGKTYNVTVYFKWFDLTNPDGGVIKGYYINKMIVNE
jgi:hypothetical protein